MRKLRISERDRLQVESSMRPMHVHVCILSSRAWHVHGMRTQVESSLQHQLRRLEAEKEDEVRALKARLDRLLAKLGGLGKATARGRAMAYYEKAVVDGSPAAGGMKLAGSASSGASFGGR